VDERLVHQLSTLNFTDTAQNAVLIGVPGTGKTHLATAIGVAGIAAKGKRVRFYSTVDLMNELERKTRRQDGPHCSGADAHGLGDLG
jgi:DNA replication protein DnaC